MRGLSLYNKIFLLFVTSLLASLSIIAWYGYKSTSDAYIKSTYDTSYQNIKTVEVAIESELSHVPKDVIFVTDFYALKNFMTWRLMDEDKKANKWKRVFSNALLDFLYTKKDYYQARVIDLDGNEIVTVKYIPKLDKVVLIEESKLQNKRGRNYVEITKNLKKGEFHISEMNLNIDHGKIERPFMPVIRFSTPIIGSNGKAVAIFVLNFYAQSILDLVDAQAHANEKKGISYYLVDKNGDYLYHNRKEKRWASQLKHTVTFNQEHFSIEDTFKNKKEGSFSKNEKIYSFHKIQSFSLEKNKFWYVISSVDEKDALIHLEDFKALFIVLIVFVMLLGFFIVRFFILRITAPITLVTKQLNALSRGEIRKEDIVYKSEDEISQIVESTKKVTSSIEKIIKQANLVADGELNKEIKLLGENDALGLAINNMTKRLQEIENLAQNLSRGNYETSVVAKSSNDKLGLALINMIFYLQKVTNLFESIAKGDIELDYEVIGDEDRLGRAMLKMISYLKTIVNQANAISQEDFSQSIELKSDYDTLGSAMVTMTSILSNNHTRNKEEVYFSEGVGDFSDMLTGIDNTEELAHEAITMMTRYIDASSGLLYIYNGEKKCLNLVASFAHINRSEAMSFDIGEGIVGQVALDKKYMLLKGIENDNLKIESGIISAQPQEVFIFPLIHEGELFGVIEILSFNMFLKIQRDYLLKAAGILATALHLTSQNAQIKVLLEKSQRAFEELQTQSEELQESNVQMEEQQQQLTLQSFELKEKNDTLVQAKEEINKRADELEKASKYKSEFLANMSHELRTPLNSIILLSKLLSQNQDDNLNEKDIKKAKIINKSGNDLLFLINDILDLTKIESGNMELDLNTVHTKDFLGDMKDLFGEIAREKSIEFIAIDNFNSQFISDKSKLAQVLKNILSNAMKFTSEGSVYLEIYKDKGKLNILVKDTGIGIANDKIEGIFEAFKQVDGSISREFGGTGLGLSITKTIVELMQGDIIVESKVGEGTSFIISLPLNESLKKVLVDKIPQIKQEINPKKQILSVLQEESIVDYFDDELRGKNILIVDDDSRNIFTLTSALESSGAEIYTAFNGQEALDLLDEEEEIINLILMDVMMPVMDGLLAIETIKAHDKHKNIPIIAITAKTTIEDKQKCLDAGADEYLAKPVEFNALFVMIKAWIH